MKQRKAYGINLVLSKNYQKVKSKEFVEKLKSLPGFIGITNYAGGHTQAALFDSQSNRNKAYRILSEEIQCAIILETAYLSI